MTHEVNFPDYLWRLAQQASGTRNPASWIRNRIGELLTQGVNAATLVAAAAADDSADWSAGPDPLLALGIYAKTDQVNFYHYAYVECAGSHTLAVKALASKDNPTAFLQWWADKQIEGEQA